MIGNLLGGKLIEKTREDENSKITEHPTTKKKTDSINVILFRLFFNFFLALEQKIN